MVVFNIPAICNKLNFCFSLLKFVEFGSIKFSNTS